MKIIIAAFIVSASLLPVIVQGQTTPEAALPDSVKYSPKMIIRDAPQYSVTTPQVLFTINNKPVPFDSVKNLNTKHIKSIHVLKAPEAAALYGQRAKDGAVVIELKKLPKK